MDKKLKTAFTLVELLVVIAIVGILSGLIIVGMNTSIQQASIAKAQIFSSSLRDSMMANLVSEWKFDGPTAVDAIATNNDILDSWGTNNGTISASVEPTVKGGSDCIYNKCLSFNGSKYFSVPNFNFTGDFTIDMWMKLGALPANQTNNWPGFMGKGSSFTFEIIKASGKIGFTSSGGSALYTTKVFNDLNWHNIVITAQGTFRKYYVDGIDDNTNNSNITPANNANALFFGRGWSDAISAVMDNIRIYNALIPTSQIREQYYSGITRLYSTKEINNNEYLTRISQITNTLASK